MSDTGLSDREEEILKLVATGVSNKEIARHLVISPNTVKVHLRNIFAKIGVVSRTEATLYAIQHGIVPAGLIQSPAANLENDQSRTLGDQVIAGGLLAVSAPIGVSEIERPPVKWARLGLIGLVVLAVLVLSGLGIRSIFFQPQANPPKTASTGALQARWAAAAVLPEARQGLAVSAYEDQIYAIGGETSKGISGRVDSYTPATDSWKTMAPKPHPVTDIQAVLLGEKIYVPGGRQPDGKPANFLEVLDPRHNSWENKASLPVAVSAYALAALDGKLYLFGGWDGTQYLASVYEYDPSQDTWQERAPMSTQRAWAAATALNGKIYVMGGYDGQKALADNLAYYPQREDDGENPWESFAPLPAGRYGMVMDSLVDTVYVMGGKGQASLSNLEFIPQTNLWIAFENPPVQIGEGAGIAPIDNRIYVLGGAVSGKVTPNNQVYQAIYTVVIPLIQK